MAGKKDIVEQALKLIAGGVKEAGPSAAERAAQNLDVFNTAKRLGEDTNDIAKLQETKRLIDYHKGLMGDVKERVKALAEIQRQMREQGAFPMEVGTRYTTEQTRRLGQPPYVVQGYYINPKDPYNSYGYRYRQEYPNGDFSEGHAMIRDPKLEKLHGPEKWEEIQKGIIPMTGPKVVKNSGGRTSYGPGGVIDDIVNMAGKIVSGADEPAATGIRAYHGSPHDFERFDMSKIGTGEGAQAYGHGLYFAESEPVAQGYRDALSPKKVAIDGQMVDSPTFFKAARRSPSVDDNIAMLNKQRENILKDQAAYTSDTELGDFVSELYDQQLKDVDKEIAELSQHKGKWFGTRPGGSMYEVNIDADPNTFLDWDKPLSEHPQEVRDALQKYYGFLYPDKEQQGWTGKDVAQFSTMQPEHMKRFYEETKIPGIRYFDAGSRPHDDVIAAINQYGGKDQAIAGLNAILKGTPSLAEESKAMFVLKELEKPVTRNYVVFDDKLISIIRKYGIAGASAMLGYNLMDGLDSKQALAAKMADQDYQNASGQGEPRVAKGGGGAALEKALEKALLVAREGIEGLSRSEGKTPQELLGGFANQKPRVPFEEWRYEFEPTADLLQSKEFSPESLKPGDVIIPLIGDRTSTGRKITSIAGQPLETPAITEGGPDYMRGPSQQADKSVWASGKGVISQLEGRIQNALRASEAKGYKDPSVYGSYVAMGPQSGDFSTHTAEAVMGMLPGSKIKRADVKEFDAKMRERFADWPGLKSPKAADYVINANAGEHRKAFLDVMDSAYWRDKGFPDVSLARYATTTPELVSAPTEAAGYNIARITPSQKPELITQIHRSYPSTMHGEYVGGLPAGMTRDELFTQFSRGFDADPPARNYVMAKRRSFGMDPNAFQVMDEPEIQALIDKVERIKQGYEQGGEVYEDDDINDALRIAKDNGGSTGSVFMTDAKGINYDINGNIIPPEVTGPNPARSEATPEQVGQRAAQDPATFDALMQKYAVPDQDIARYEATKAAVAKQPYETQQMTHVGAPPMRDVKVDMPLLGGEKKITQAPYNVAGPMAMAAQAAYDLKTVPLYFTPFTAPIGAGLDVGEGVATGDPLQASLAALGAPGKYAKAAIIGGSNYLMSPAEAQAGPARWFSKAMEVANAIPMNKMTGEQALAMLRKGTSPEELKWTGTDVFLQGKPQVTKQELVDFIEKNRVKVNEVTFADRSSKYPYKSAEGWQHAIDRAERAGDWEEAQRLTQAWEEYEGLGGFGTPKFKKYSTSGGEGYQETLITLPTKGAEFDPAKVQIKRKPYSTTQGDVEISYGDKKIGTFAEKIEMDPSGRFVWSPDNYWVDLVRKIYHGDPRRGIKPIGDAPLYKSGHWPETPNVLAHTRSQILDVTPPGANRPYKAWNVDETQSDWGQEGRKQGFRGLFEKEFEQANQDFSLAKRNVEETFDALSKAGFTEDQIYKHPDFLTADKIASDAGKRFDEINLRNKSGIKAAPYVTSTEGWTDLAIKKQLDKALDSESDYFTWTPGDVQAERYDLTQHIGEINARPTGDGLVHLEAISLDGGSQVFSKVYPIDKIDQAVGKEIADKIRSQIKFPEFRQGYRVWNKVSGNSSDMFATEKEAEKALRAYPEGIRKDLIVMPLGERIEGSPVFLSGLDLKTGGEGMRGYYDKVYLKRVQDVIKKATGEKPNIEVIEVQTANGPRKQLGIRLTDEMREKARFSDFNKGGRVTGGNTYDNDSSVAHALALTSEY